MKVERSVDEVQPLPDATEILKTVGACVAAALVPGFGHALLRKWDRALVFFCSITLMFYLGLMLEGRLFNPEFSGFFVTLKFIADAAIGMLYWVCWLGGLGAGEPRAYTYDFGNVFIYVAGLLNMLVVVDVFDISMGRKK